MNSRKLVLSAAVVLIFLGYVAYEKNIVSGRGSLQNSTSNIDGIVSSSAEVQKKVSSVYRDGVYTGVVADAYYGNIQVRAAIVEGVLTDVQFLQYPHDRDTSVQINREAMPLLKSEAVKIQSSKVDVVSGATDTSAAFVESLESALAAAKHS